MPSRKRSSEEGGHETGGELNILYKGVKTFSSKHFLKIMRGSQKGKGHISWRCTWGCYISSGIRTFGETKRKTTKAYTQSREYHTIMEVHDF